MVPFHLMRWVMQHGTVLKNQNPTSNIQQLVKANIQYRMLKNYLFFFSAVLILVTKTLINSSVSWKRSFSSSCFPISGTRWISFNHLWVSLSSFVQRSMFSVQDPTSNVQLPTSNIQCSMFSVQCSVFKIQHPTLKGPEGSVHVRAPGVIIVMPIFSYKYDGMDTGPLLPPCLSAPGQHAPYQRPRHRRDHRLSAYCWCRRC